MKKYFYCFVLFWVLFSPQVRAGLGTYASLHEDQNKEKIEVEKMKQDLKEIKPKTDEYTDDLNDLSSQLNDMNVTEIHLMVRANILALDENIKFNALTYNNTLPGPIITVNEGSKVKIVVHNQLTQSTSFYIQGMILDNDLSGLPDSRRGLIEPGKIGTYEFTVNHAGTYLYHPQVTHFNQMNLGLYGAILVLPKQVNYDREFLLLFSEINSQGKTCYLINGKQAPQIPPLQVSPNQRIRLHFVNAASHSIPIALTGHKLEIISQDGSDELEPHVIRDGVTINPGSRMDCEFTSDNPGTWSLSSLDFNQASYNGKFPGGIACVLKYKSK